MKDFYYILGVDANCTLDEIKEAYRKLSKKLHPDLNQGDTYFENRFKDINEAFETLYDPEKRITYDRRIKKSRQEPFNEASSNGRANPPPPVYKMSRRRGPGLGMTIVLILITLIISDYFIRSFSKTKKLSAKIVYIVPAPSVKIHKTHKKRHVTEVKTKSDHPEHKSDSSKAHLANHKPVIGLNQTKPTINALQPKPITIKAPAKQTNIASTQAIQVKDENPGNKGEYLYATYVHPNATGIVNLRRNDNYNSEVIARVPANSKVFVLERGNDYYKVVFGDITGYVPKWALQVK